MKSKVLTGTVVVALSGMLLAQEVQPGEALVAKEGSCVRVNVGATGRWGGRIRSRWDGAALQRGLSGRLPGGYRSEASMTPATGYADRDYADGYVYRDDGTTDPETEVYGLTWFWGYDNASQYDGASVRFHSVEVGSERTARFLDAPSVGADEDVEMWGATLSADYRIWEGTRGTGSLQVGLNYYAEQDAEFGTQQAVAEVRETTYRWEDVYAAPHPDFPAASYAGTWEGPGYLLSNQPDSRTKEVLSSRREIWMADSRASVHVEQLDLRVGAAFEMALSGSVSAALEVAANAAMVSLELDSDTRVMAGTREIARLSQHASEDAWVWGVGLAGSVNVALSEHWSLGGRMGYDWWADEVSVKAVPYEVEYELGDWTASVTIQREF